MNLLEIIEQLIEEKGVDKDTLSAIVCEGMLAAYQKKYPELELQVEYDEETGQLNVACQKKVVAASPSDEDREISLRKARAINSNINVDDLIWVPVSLPIGRIEILKAKQIIASKIRQIEASMVYDAFKDKEGSIVQGTVHKVERAGLLVKLQDTLAFLPKSLAIPNEKYIVGQPIRAILKEVLPEPRNENQLILERRSSEFLQNLLELEIPEVFDRLVEIKKIVRSPGYKSKIAVLSNDPNIDPVGTCVGVGGARIKPVLKELAGEKIDVISWTNKKESLVKDALKPALVDRVEIVGDDKALVWVDEDQRSLAIGKMGQNIALASKLAEMDIQLAERAGGEDVSAVFEEDS